MVSQYALQWAKVREDEYAMEPSRAHDDDAGYDLYVSESVWLNPGQFHDIPTNVRVRLPETMWAMLTGRSSTLRKQGLLVNQGVIDTGYTGELYAGAFNLTDKPVLVEQGQRISQLILMPNATIETRMFAVPPEFFDRLEGGRGTSGFGSSGR
jgi:dUTP pyrophosphatase